MEGVIIVFIVTGVCPNIIVRAAGEIVTADTGVGTITTHFAVFAPSTVVTVIVAVPIATACTVPSEATVATLELLLVQITSLTVADAGEITAFNFASGSPTFKEKVLLSVLTPVTRVVTVTVQLAVLLPSIVVAVIVASNRELPSLSDNRSYCSCPNFPILA